MIDEGVFIKHSLCPNAFLQCHYSKFSEHIDSKALIIRELSVAITLKRRMPLSY